MQIMSTPHRHAPSTARTDIVPFWNRLREISLYPTRSGALTTIIVLAVCQLIAFFPLGFFGWIAQLLIWVALYKYAFECLRATADGRLEPPEVAVSVEDSLGWSQIWLQVAFFALNLIGFIVFGPVGGAFMLTAVRSYLTRVDTAATAVTRVATAAGALPTRVTGAVTAVRFIPVRPGISPDVVGSVATAVGPMPSGLHHAPIADAKRAA